MESLPEEGQHHSPDEAERAINGLPDSYWLRLHRWATWRLFGNSVAEADEVIADVYERFCKGSRKWPIGIPIDTCFWNAVRSAVSGEWSKHTTNNAKHVSISSEEESYGFPSLDHEPLSRVVHAAELQKHQRIVDHICGAFIGDRAVTAVLEGLEQDLPAREVQKASGLTETQYDSARKRLRRFINKHYPNGWRSHGQRRQESESLA